MLSFTKISTWKECGKKFQYKYLDKVYIDCPPEKQNTFDRGTLIHALIAKYLTYAKTLSDVTNMPLEDNYQEAKTRACLAYQSLPVTSKGAGFNRTVGRDCYPELTEEVACNILTVIQEEVLNGWRIYGIELKDFASFNNFYSIFDCVLYYDKGNTRTYKIIDWKTGSKPHAPITGADDQLAYYAVQLANRVASETRDKTVTIQAQYVTILNKSFKVHCGSVLEIPKSFMMLASSDIGAMQNLDNDTPELRATLVKNTSNPFCRWCEYAEICKADRDTNT